MYIQYSGYFLSLGIGMRIEQGQSYLTGGTNFVRHQLYSCHLSRSLRRNGSGENRGTDVTLAISDERRARRIPSKNQVPQLAILAFARARKPLNRREKERKREREKDFGATDLFLLRRLGVRGSQVEVGFAFEQGLDCGNEGTQIRLGA